ncbi:PLP-dependent transferase [Cryphonectria parasitica EP155]|uniref:PLP-dependent transferase n=1 Tax=Cryphonectria parasitica (strain ATCC 38755 / EP155) TaxID=660469 RepID=A0A9P4XWG5_CRYP1|nr:PLP-dependent transferase [Cryphonectria parasitica EP155]KAF3762577.1 PLP-dependent transferase [Cryphonectria parasitica EP155]
MATVVKPIATEFGHSLPPEGPHTITIHGPGWQTALGIRDGDPAIFARLKSIYPRFFPFSCARQLSVALAQKLGADPSQDGVLMFTDPETFALHRAYSTSHHRKQHKLAEGDLSFRVVDVHGVRLYCVVYPLPKMPGTIGIWQNVGNGLSSRASEELLGYVGGADFSIVEWSGEDLSDVPPASYLPECEAHGALRKRIRDLLHRAPVDSAAVKVADGDVYLYPTGMAAIWRLNQILVQRDAGTILVLGSVFHNTFHMFEETTSGMKHFGACDAKSGVMDKVEEYLEAHYKAGKTVSYVFVEFPSNPILVSADLKKLHQIAGKYRFPVVIDDTISSFVNVDVLPVADLLMTSLTKSFSGYADVMGGSVVLNPLSPFYQQIKPSFTANFHNELFAGDAERLLSNSEDYIPRSTILNRNAVVMAEFLATEAARPGSPIKAVLYPSTSDTKTNYEAFMRPATPDFAPGYGCLLSVDFKTLPAAKAFYDNLSVHQGPHLGAHKTLAVPMNALVWGKDPEQTVYHAAYGAGEEQKSWWPS